MKTTEEFLAMLRARADSGIPAVADTRLLREAIEYIDVVDSGLDRAMETAEKASALVQLQGREIERLRAVLTPFAEPHPMGDAYVQFSPKLIEAARAALK